MPIEEAEKHSLKVFLAHSHHDKELARELYWLLKTDGFEPWLDEESLLPGQDFEQEIKKAVSSTDVFVILLGRKSVDKAGYLHKELAFALETAQRQPEGSIYLIPLRLGGCELPDRVKHLHWLEVDTPQEAIGSTYQSLQRSLLERARQLRRLGKPGTESEPEELPRAQARGLPKTGCFAEGPKAAGRESAEYRSLSICPEGNYLVRGRNPDKQRYNGTAEIAGTPESLTLTTRVGPHVLRYSGRFNGVHLTFTGAHNVAYSLEGGGVLVGHWEDDCLEELIPASPFSQQAPLHLAKLGEEALATNVPVTTAGLTWKVVRRGMIGEKATTVLHVEAINELPQPLELYVTSLARLTSVRPKFIPNPTQPTAEDLDAEFEVFLPEDKLLRLRLVAPKLHPPGYLDVLLQSQGNAEIRIVEVTRAMRSRGSSP